MTLHMLFALMIAQVAAIQAEVTKQQQETEEDLAKAEPALQAANTALNTLNRVKCFHPRKCRDLSPPCSTFGLFVYSYFIHFVQFHLQVEGEQNVSQSCL